MGRSNGGVQPTDGNAAPQLAKRFENLNKQIGAKLIGIALSSVRPTGNSLCHRVSRVHGGKRSHGPAETYANDLFE